LGTIDLFLKIDGIEGECQDVRHKGEIELESWDWGATQSGSHADSSGGRGKVNMKDLRAVMKVNKASPKLMLACATGDHIQTAVLTCRKAKPGKEQQEYLKITLSDLLVSSYQTGISPGVTPTEEFSLNFARIEVEYKEQKADGSLGAPIRTGYCRKTNKKV
jgi:type VI secretion system secreted protein Hcp